MSHIAERFPINPEAMDQRLGEKEIQEIRDHLAKRSRDELEMMVEYLNHHPSEESMRTGLQGTKYSKYPVEEAQRVFLLLQALIKAELKKRTTP